MKAWAVETGFKDWVLEFMLRRGPWFGGRPGFSRIGSWYASISWGRFYLCAWSLAGQDKERQARLQDAVGRRVD